MQKKQSIYIEGQGFIPCADDYNFTTDREEKIMIDIIRELYLGNVTPNQQLKPEHASYKENTAKSCEAETLLLKRLKEDEKDMYDEMMHYHMELLSQEDQQAFVDGFRLGVLLFMDVMRGAEKYGRN